MPWYGLVAAKANAAGQKPWEGVGVFVHLWVFLVAILAGLAVHALVYYPLSAWLVGRIPPQRFLPGAVDAVITAV